MNKDGVVDKEEFAAWYFSGMKPLLERPGSRELTDTMDANDVIVATKLDRIARSPLEMINMIPNLEETGITLYFCDMFGDVPMVLPKEKEKTGKKCIRHCSESTIRI